MRRIIVFLICIALISNNPIMDSMACSRALNDYSSSIFHLNICCLNGDVDPSGIEIRVYSSEVVYEDEVSGYVEYSESYEFCVYPDCYGSVYFERPSSCFSLSVNLETLPVGYGVDVHTRFFFPETHHYQIALAEISSVQGGSEGGVIVPIVEDVQGNRVFSDAHIQKSYNAVSLSSINTDNKQIDYSEDFMVSLQGKAYLFTRDSSYYYSNDYEKAEFLYQNGFISQYEYISELSRYALRYCGEIH